MKKIINFVTILALLTSCASISNKREKLLLYSMRYNNSTKNVIDSNVTLEFDKNHAFGQSFNNRYFANYTFKDDNILLIDNISSTKMATSDIENKYFDLLEGQKKYMVVDNMFEIYDKTKNEKLCFINIIDENDLDKKTFVLESDNNISISFDKDKVYGKMYANRYFGTFVIKNSKISFKNISQTLVLSDDKTQKKENEFLEKLEKEYIVTLHKDKLVLIDNDSNKLQFNLKY